MRNREGLAPPGVIVTPRRRVVPALLAVLLLGSAAFVVVPRGIEAQSILSEEDDPAAIADRALEGVFSAGLVQREIEAALAANDPDLAKSFVDLAEERRVPVDPALAAKVAAAVAEAASAQHAVGSFARGLIIGEPDDLAGFAGTTLGDLFVFGDIRDVVREGSRFANGEKVDELILGLACVGLAITAGTYATMGGASPARVGLSVAKAARKTGRLSADLAGYIGRSLRGVVDWDRLKAAIVGASITEPALAMRAARAAVKTERAGGLLHLVRDVGRVQGKAGTQAALDGLKIAGTPREMSRVALLAEKKAGKTRAILKVVGRGAIMLTVTAFNLGLWMFGALLTLFGFVSSMKGATERLTHRYVQRRKERRLLEDQRRFAALTVRG